MCSVRHSYNIIYKKFNNKKNLLFVVFVKMDHENAYKRVMSS